MKTIIPSTLNPESMSKTKPGFTIFELVVGIMLSSILITAAFTIYDQITRTSRAIQKITTYDTQAMILQDRMQKDLTGLSPLWFTKHPYEKAKSLKEKPDEQSPKTMNPETKENGFFYAENNDDGTLNYLTFITTNAMQMFGETNQRFVRVVYTLKKDPKNESQFQLLRKEIDQISSEFEQQALFEKGKFYALARNIVSYSLEYLFIDTETKDDQPSVEIKTLQEWGVVKEKSDGNEKKRALPHFIKLTVTFANDNNDKQAEYDIVFTVPVDPNNKIESFIEKRNKEKKQSKKSDDKKDTKDNKGDKDNKKDSKPDDDKKDEKNKPK